MHEYGLAVEVRDNCIDCAIIVEITGCQTAPEQRSFQNRSSASFCVLEVSTAITSQQERLLAVADTGI